MPSPERASQADGHARVAHVPAIDRRPAQGAQRRRLVPLVAFLLLVGHVLPRDFASVTAADGSPRDWRARAIDRAQLRPSDRSLLASLPGSTRIGYHPETRRVRFLSASPGRPLTAALPAVASGRRRLTLDVARARASRFVERYGELFGLAAAGRELRPTVVRRYAQPASARAARARAAKDTAASGATSGPATPFSMTVRFDQVRAGVPVMGGQIVVQLSDRGEVISAAGEIMPSTSSATVRPRLTAAQAADVAAAWLARQVGRPPGAVSLRSEGLALYDARLMGGPWSGPTGPRLVWRIDAVVPGSARREARRQLVLVDARGGQVLAAIGRIYRAERLVCDNAGVPGRSYRCDPPFARREGQPSTGIADVDVVYRIMGSFDAFLASRFGRSGLDGQGARLKATVRYCAPYGCPWRNAEWKWAEQQAIFGTGWARADDIVAHELVHGLLDDEVPLFYQYQSGAINESLADIFGEVFDLSDPGGTDTPATRWQIGEDTPRGTFRDMQDPTRFKHPDRVRSPFWHVSPADDGGVHRNSGVGNKAAALIADGGSFRGVSITGIGEERMARLFYQALTTRLTPAANYLDLADALVAACVDLTATGTLTMAQCASVRDAVRATQMDLEPVQRAPRKAPLCARGRRPIDSFRDDLEDPAAGHWVVQRLIGARRGWYYPQNPNHDPKWDGTWASSGRHNFYGADFGVRSDVVIQLRSPVQVPPGAFLRFEHGYSFDADGSGRYDGGVVEARIDGGPWRSLEAQFTHGGYNGQIARGQGSPLAGRRAFTGDSHGWSSARVDLKPFAGQWLRLRFRVASDRAVSGLGWYVDDIRVYTCAADTDKPNGSLTINGGAQATSDANVSLSIAYADVTTWVTELRVSGDPGLGPEGLLVQGITMPVRDSLAWSLVDPAYGYGQGAGPRAVYGQVRDAAGNWSDVFSAGIELLAAS